MVYAALLPLMSTPRSASSRLNWRPTADLNGLVRFAERRVVGGRCQAHCAWQRPPTARPTTFHVWKTRGCQCSFRLLMMGGVSSETCCASYKYGIIKNFDIFLHLVGFFFMKWEKVFLWNSQFEIFIFEQSGRWRSYTDQIMLKMCRVRRSLNKRHLE